MSKKYLEKDVLQAAFERLEIIFDEFENIYISVSGGKDSTAMILKLIEDRYPLDEVIFYDTGMEFKAIYNAW